MNSFVAKHAEINGVLECFDRVILRGHLPMAGVGYFSTWLYSKQISLNLRRASSRVGGNTRKRPRGSLSS